LGWKISLSECGFGGVAEEVVAKEKELIVERFNGTITFLRRCCRNHKKSFPVKGGTPKTD